MVFIFGKVNVRIYEGIFAWMWRKPAGSGLQCDEIKGMIGVLLSLALDCL